MFHIKVACEASSDTMNNNNRKSPIKSSKEEEKSDELASLKFFAGNPSIEITEGTIHLYKNQDKVINKSELICVLAIPTYMSVADFANFTGGHHKNISNMRILRDGSQTRYMAIMKFSTQEAADDFYEEFRGKPFSSLESETCILLYVASVEFIKPHSSALLFPPLGQIELPTCPVCLDRLDDSASGILTIICNHTFHCSCLAKWKGENSCPVCRYCMEEPQSPTCSECHTTESLWICLICGNVGCGRYVNEHARQHYKETMHAYALELQTSRVWDYVGDGYVHRLVQNKSDGKLVPVPEPESRAQQPDQGESHVPETKIESISLEYSYILEAQRAYFEEQMRKVDREKFRKISYLEEEYAQLLHNKELQDKRMREMDDEKRRSDRKIQTLEKKMKDMEKEGEFLKQVNQALKENQDEWKAKITELDKKMSDALISKDKRIGELEEQIKDLMFFIEAKDKVAANGELADGSLLVLNNNNNTTPSNTRKIKRKPRT